MEQKQEKRGVSALFQPVDLTQGTCWKTILVFSLPIILSYLLQQVYSISEGAMTNGAFAVRLLHRSFSLPP